MFNAGVRGKRAKDSTGLITVGEHFNQQNYLVPTVTRFAVTDGSYVDTNDTAADTAGNQTIVVYGSGFAPGATILVGSTTISVVTFLDSGRLAFSSPALGSGSYTIFVTNANGGTGILVPGLVYSGVPTFTTAAGSLGSVYETTAINTTVVATGDAPITYALSSGSLPSGSTLSSGGTISGTAPVDGSSTTYSFTIQATDADNQDSVRSFSLTINTDVVSFSSPANNTTTTATQNSPISNVTVTATSAAGYGVLYTSSGLPIGLSMNTSTGIISGTPTVVASNTSIITATANTTTRTAALYLNWTINLPGDLFWKYASLLMTANPVPNGNTFNTDLSTFNNEIVVVADTKPNEFHPFKEGYYSNYFDGTGDFLSLPVSTNYDLPGDFTIESWIYPTGTRTTSDIIAGRWAAGATIWQLGYDNTNKWALAVNGSNLITYNSTIVYNTWYHIAITRSGTTVTMWLNGVSVGTATSSFSLTSATRPLLIGRNADSTDGSQDWLGYISNFRIVKGTALYTAAFTPPTAPLTYVANTAVLTCQSNRLIDNSNNNFTITKNGDVTINPFSPFNGTPTTVTVPGTNNYSMYFDGTGDYLSGPTNYPFITTGPFTIELWVYQPSLALKALLNNARWNIGQNGGFRVNLSASGAVVLDASTGTYNTYPNVFTTTSTITASTWTHIAIVRNSSNSISCYINGVLARTPVTYASSLSLSSDGNIGQFIVGAGIYDGGAADLFNGYMSNIRIINDALYTGDFTPSNSPLALTQSSSANTAAITALPTNGGSVYFDGSSDYLTVPSNTWTTLAGQFTIEFWVNFGAAPTSNPFIGVSSTGGFTIYNDGTRISPNLFGTGNIFNSTFTTAGIVIGRWYHIAVTRNSSNLMTMWADGVSVGSATTSTTYTQGTWQIGNSNFRCHISNLRIANTCLYTSTFTPSTTPLTAVANTILLTCQSSSASNNRIILDNGNNAYTITSVGDTIAKTLSPFANTPAILMAQANTVIDSSNNGITFTVSGDTRPARNGPFANTTTVTLIGNEGSTYFDGTGDYLTIPNNPSHAALGTSDFTLELWFNQTVLNVRDNYLISHRVSNFAPFLFWINSAGSLRFYASSDLGSWNLANDVALSAISLNTWNHFAYTRNGSTFRVFLNGAQVYTFTSSATFTTATTALNIGGQAGGTDNFTGYVSNARFVKGTALYTTPFVPSWATLTPVANTVLLTAQTNLSSNTKSFVDESNLNSVVTGFGNATLGSFSPFGSTWSGYFDGTGDYLSGSSSRLNFGANDFSIEFWMWPVNTSTNSQIIFQAGSGNLAILLMTNGIIEPGQYQTAGISQSTAGAIVAGVWHHVVVTRTGTAFRTFINGILRGYGARSFSPNNSSYTIGGAAAGTAYTGYISNFKVIANSIPALYTTSSTTVGTTIFTTPTVPFVSEANTVLLTCNSNRFVDYSAANNAITRTGDATVSRFSPFSPVPVTPASYSGYFDGTGDYLSIANNSAFDLSTGTPNWTIECWFITNLASSQQTLVQKDGVSGSRQNQYILMINASNQIQVTVSPASGATGNQNFISNVTVTTNTWYHVAAVRNGNNITVFLNGVIIIGPTALTVTMGNNTGPLTIGANNPGASYLSGYISNLRAVKGTAVYTAAFTPSTTPLTAIANTQLLTCQSTTFIDNSNNAFTITRNGDAKPVIQNPFIDTIGAGISYTANTYGNSMYFDGTTDYLTVPYSSNFNIPASTPFTFECWAYTTSTNIFVMANRNWSFGSTGSTWGFGLNNGTSPFWSIGGTGASTYNMLNAGLPGALGQWNHYAWTRDSSNVCRVYTNGIEASSVTRTDSQAMTSASGSIFIGVSSNLASAYANGYMSNMRFLLGQCLYASNFIPSNQPLPPTSNTVLLLSSTSGPSVTDALRISNMETTGTARQVANNSPYYDTYSAYFDGTGDYLNYTASLSLTGAFTAQCWFYNTSSSGAQQTLFTFNSASGNGYGSLRVDCDQGNVQYNISTNLSTSGTGWATTLSVNSAYIKNTWNHVAVTRDASNVVRLFLNGVQIASGTQAGTLYNTSTTHAIGCNNLPGAATNPFQGYISNLQLVNGTAVYTTTFTPPTSPLTAIANTSLLTCQSNSFVDKSTNAFTITKNGDAKITTLQPFTANNTSRYTSVYFPAKTDYLAIRPQPSLTTFPGDFTFECWVYPTDTTLTSAWSIWDARQSGATAAATTFSLAPLASPVTGSWRMAYFNGTNYYGTGTVLWNQWTHLAWVRNGTTMTFYVNGVAGGTATISGTQTATATTNPIYIGTKDNGLAGYGTIGYIADLRITNGYARTITVPTAPYDVK